MQRIVSYRQGDRSEYLAQYILSAIAISVPVPRQEDVGSDFHCSLLRREGVFLRPYLPFNIQIKSSGGGAINFGGVTDGGHWRKHEIEQACQSDTPFLIGIVNKDEQWMDIFSTITRYFVHYNWKKKGQPRTLKMIPYIPEGEGHLSDGAVNDLDELEGMPNFHWDLPIGQPIVRVSVADSESPEQCEIIKGLLEPFLIMDQENAVFARIRLGYFKWPLIIKTGQPLVNIGVGLASPSLNSPAITDQLRVLGRSVASLLVSFRLAGLKQEIVEWETILKYLPLAEEPPFIQQTVAEVLAFGHS